MMNGFSMSGMKEMTAHASFPGFTNYPMFVSDLAKAIDDQAFAVRWYEALLSETSNPLHQRWIRHAYEDEKKHLHMFSSLYQRMTGQMHPIRGAEAVKGDYKTQILHALEEELKASEAYRTMYLNTTIPELRDTLFEAMTDEMEHAMRFSFIYQQI